MGKIMQLYVKTSSNCRGLPLQSFELLSPEWSGSEVRLPFGEPPNVRRLRVVGWTDLFGGHQCDVHIARVRWLPSSAPNIMQSSLEPCEGYLVWGGNSGVRILDSKARPTPGVDDHLPRGHGQPIIWVEDVNDLPSDVRESVGGQVG